MKDIIDYGTEDMTADELAYNRYLKGEYSYADYLVVCRNEDVSPLPPEGGEEGHDYELDALRERDEEGLNND